MNAISEKDFMVMNQEEKSTSGSRSIECSNQDNGILFDHPNFDAVLLRLPIDWSGEQFENKNWRHNFQKLDWLLPKLTDPGRSTHKVAVEFVEDYVDFFCSRRGDIWAGSSDHTLADRVVILVKIWRLVKKKKIIMKEESIHQLKRTIERHISRMMSPNVYREWHNHGIMVNYALLAVTRIDSYFDKGGEIGREIIGRIHRQIILLHDNHGFTKEHSIGYQITNLNRFIEAYKEVSRRAGGSADGLKFAIERTIEATSILCRMMLRPDGTYATLGDTRGAYEIPRAVARAMSQDKNISLSGDSVFIAPGAGFAAYKGANLTEVGQIHATLTCGWHSRTHKHNDDTSFTLSYGDANIVNDPGYSLIEPDLRQRSELYHNVVTVKDRPWLPIAEPNGMSRILAWGVSSSAACWVARHGRIPGVTVERTLAILANGVTIVMDRPYWTGVGDRPNAYESRLQLGPGVTVEHMDGTITLTHRDATVATIHAEASPEVQNGFAVVDHRMKPAKSLVFDHIDLDRPWIMAIAPAGVAVGAPRLSRLGHRVIVSINEQETHIPLRPAIDAEIAVRKNGKVHFKRLPDLFAAFES